MEMKTKWGGAGRSRETDKEGGGGRAGSDDR